MRRKLALLLAAATTATTLLSAPAALAADAGDATEDGVYCKYEEWYDNISNQGKVMAAVGPSQANYNGTSRDATSTFAAQVSGTVSATFSSSLTGEINGLVTKASATVGVQLQTSMTASLGNSTTVTAGPGQTAHATYGVWRLQTYGTFHIVRQDCTSSTAGMTLWSPWYVGWNTWVS
ncbi:hypothetical protein ACIA8O_38760 [Kitasatospora sp. NPDC051853]|uniref:hypothetical protein n=1 Tax=Kitasatospora sp. NPDC051853 TaxID=3364058 RepID=UPI003795E380